MGNVLAGLSPQPVWNIFEEICQHPHPSKKEEKLAAYIFKFAEDLGLEIKKDALGNFVIKKPATPGMENRKAVVIQGHIDMVCEKNSDVEFDFDNDPIQPYVDGDWVKAKGTTLGADNGIGVAMGMAVLQSTDIPHPAFELLCTLDEETGLTGAMDLGTDLLEADILINLDSEEDGAFTIGCAGGLNTAASYKYEAAEVPAAYEAYKIAVKGLKGGHSGIEIHDGRGNSIKFITRVIWHATKNFGVRLSSIDGGNKHNAIPREAFATVLVPSDKTADFESFVADHNNVVKAEYATKEPNLEITATKTDSPSRIMTKEFQGRLVASFYAQPHGVIRMSPNIKDLVQTSTNFAIVETREDEVYVLTSQRSSVETEKDMIEDQVTAAFELGGASVTSGDGYPAWQPNMNSPILNTAIDIFEKMYGKKPVIEAIHAGLECGLIGEKYPSMDMLSFGPNLKEVHSPDEMIQISTVERCWNFLVELLKNIPAK